MTDDDALAAFKEVSQLEGIIPALETSHALAHLKSLCQQVLHGTKIVLNFSGRGEKGTNSVMKHLDLNLFRTRVETIDTQLFLMHMICSRQPALVGWLGTLVCVWLGFLLRSQPFYPLHHSVSVTYDL